MQISEFRQIADIQYTTQLAKCQTRCGKNHAIFRVIILYEQRRCVARKCKSRVLARGRFTPPPKTPHAFCPRSAGSTCFFKALPAVVFPPRLRSAPPPEGAAPLRLPPRELPLHGGRAEARAWSVVTLQSLAACVPPPDTRAAALAALMLALRSLNARGFRAFLRRFRFGGAKSLPCGLRARRRPPRIWCLRAADVSGNFLTRPRFLARDIPPARRIRDPVFFGGSGSCKKIY